MLTGKKSVIIVAAMILVMAVAISVSGCGLGGDPKSVVSTFFDSIDKQDAKKFLNCFDEDFAELYKSFGGDDFLEEMLESANEGLADRYGNNWRKKVRIGKSKKTDTVDDITYYEVEVEFDGKEETIGVKKVKGRFYLDENAMGGSIW